MTDNQCRHRVLEIIIEVATMGNRYVNEISIPYNSITVSE